MSTPRGVEFDHHKVKFIKSLLEGAVSQQVKTFSYFITLLSLRDNFNSCNFFNDNGLVLDSRFFIDPNDHSFFSSGTRIFSGFGFSLGEEVKGRIASDSILSAGGLVDCAVDFCNPN